MFRRLSCRDRGRPLRCYQNLHCTFALSVGLICRELGSSTLGFQFVSSRGTKSPRSAHSVHPTRQPGARSSHSFLQVHSAPSVTERHFLFHHLHLLPPPFHTCGRDGIESLRCFHCGLLCLLCLWQHVRLQESLHWLSRHGQLYSSSCHLVQAMPR